MDRISEIKNHFEREALDFDGTILKLIPYYEEMIEALVNIIPFSADKYFNAIDLGCGTGTISKAISNKFLNCNITCIDIADNMIEMAKIKLAGNENVKFMTGDFNTFKFPEKYDAVVSSLALHHLGSDNDKKNFYKKIYDSLNHNGIFYNADVILGSDEYNNSLYMEKWKQYMSKNVPINEIETKWFVNYKNEDRPVKLIDQLKWLEQIGFKDIDIVWKYYNFAVYGGRK